MFVVLELGRGTLGESPRMLSVAQLASVGIVSLVQILSAYALPSIAIGRLGAARAWARSWSIATRNLRLTAGFVWGPRILEIPIRRAIEEFSRGRTTFLITHNLGSLQFADRIVLLNDGRVEAMGTEAELRQTSPLYRRLYEIHFHRESA